MMPRSGGCYTYNRHLYGNTAGYLSGVLSFLLAFVGAAAFITLLLGVYVQEIIPGIPPAATASTVVLVFTLIHSIGLREGNCVNNFFTIFKVGVILAFIVAGFQVNVEPTVNIGRDQSRRVFRALRQCDAHGELRLSRLGNFVVDCRRHPRSQT